jgi:ribosome-associated protein
VAELRDLDLGRGRRLPARLLSARFVRAGGKGGQNVNKLATKAELRLDLDGAGAILGSDATARLRARLARRLAADGRLLVASARTRHQARNVDDALARMEALLRSALAERRKRRPTRPSRASRERRLAEKRAQSQRKRERRPSLDPS